MSLALQIEMILITIFLFYFIVRGVNKNIFSVKKIFSWLLLGVLLILLAVFPDLLTFFTELLGFKSPLNALYFFGILFLLIVVFTITLDSAKKSKEIKRLIQELSILKREVGEMRKDLEDE